MLRYKKQKRQVDGLGTSGVGIMDDTDREVSSFTDRAFRSLCVAEEEPLNDVPRLPSPIRGMPLSTKYHLGIFNLSVRKTQPLAQLPTIPRQRGKWTPTFQPLVNYAKEGMINAKTNNNRLCAPEPRGFKQHSKVSFLVKTFDNVENERPDESPLNTRIPLPTSKLIFEERPVEKIGINNDLESINMDVTGQNEVYHLHRRTAREVFLESKAEMSSPLSGSPCSSGSPLPDQLKKVVKKKDSMRRITFLHSENSAFKSWSDIHKRVIGGEENDSIPGTPPILRSATPCSPLLTRTTPGTRARDAGLDVGCISPASTSSSNYDAIQMLRTVPPLPNKKIVRQSRDSSHRTVRAPLNPKVQEEDMQVDGGHLSSKEHLNWTNKLPKIKSPQKLKHESKKPEPEMVTQKSQTFVKQNLEVEVTAVFPHEVEHSEIITNEDKTEVPDDDIPPLGRIKTLIQQMEKEYIKEVVPHNLPVKQINLIELPKDDSKALPTVALPLPTVSTNSNPVSVFKGHIPPWRRTKAFPKIEPDEKLLHTNMLKKENSTTQIHENGSLHKEDFSEEKSSSSSFNIINLLTPIIPRKNIQEALEEDPMILSLPSAETFTSKDQEKIEMSLYQKRDDYKSKATSLLFNIKDMRKRVKSTYKSAINGKNGHENNLVANVKIQEDSTHTIPVLDTVNLVSEREDLNHAPSTQNTSPPEVQKLIPYILGNASDYMSLSSPPQIMGSNIFRNGEIPTETNQTSAVMHEDNMDSISPTYNYIRKGLEQKEVTQVSRDSIQNAEESHLLTEMNLKEEENMKDELKCDEHADICVIPVKHVLEREEKLPTSPKQFTSSQEIGSEWTVESVEVEKKVENNKNNTTDNLQYFAVSNCHMEGSGSSGFVDTEIESKEESKYKLENDQQSTESACAEDIKRPSSITPSKPNLFYIKDNKIKSFPITKSVKLPLFRSLSEDCLAFKKGEEISFMKGKGDFIEIKSNMRENNYAKKDISSTENEEINNIRKHQIPLTTRPASETPKQEHTYQVKFPKEEEENMQLWNKLCCGNVECRNNKSDIAEKVNKYCNDKSSESLGGPIFHPVETCVSEVTGLSPECNTLLVHSVNDSINEFVNGEHIGPQIIDTENANYSPLDNELLQFEDAMPFSEHIACSTITSPTSENITCSIVASPLSVNTQSSGFATALSVLDDMPSSPSTGVNSRNGKFNFPVSEKLIPPHPGNMETKQNNCIKNLQEKTSSLESHNVHSAKPPTVPPKTEKALRRAKRLTKKRRKTEIPQRIQDEDFQEYDLISDAPSPANEMPSLSTPQSHVKMASSIPRGLQQGDSVSESSSPTSITQRKLLQDPDSGQYFVVDIPIYLRIKTFYDPETGKYLQMSLPKSEGATPTLEMSNSPFMLYPGLTPVPVSSIELFKEASQLLTCEKEKSWDDTEDSLKIQQFISCNSRDQSMAGTPLSMDRIVSRSKSQDIISMKDIEDFAMEAIS